MKLTSATRVTYIYPRSPYCRPNNPDLWPDVTRQQLDSKLLAGSMMSRFCPGSFSPSFRVRPHTRNDGVKEPGFCQHFFALT